MKLYHHRLKLVEAQEFVDEYHRHSPPLKRHMFSIGASPVNHFYTAKQMYGVVTVDRCSSAWSKRRDHAEVRRLCIAEEDCVTEKNLPLASFLLGKARQACFAMGYRVLITYTQPYESGASLKAAGFHIQKARAAKYDSGSVDGLVQWVCVDGLQPTEEEMRFTKQTLNELQDLVHGEIILD